VAGPVHLLDTALQHSQDVVSEDSDGCEYSAAAQGA
jgi:hypothetical protein